ncbi:hypothetical protein RND71_031328 [Anisodus tanguticus]|uniref:Uncharacterized protein n=1 Tax=Anisodus tanguticus TaxID=243964 RepID=A0AAE1RC99_9SOLA|nr:hypothetical protein RND71_031328 [Anisodus tanguticus]
MVLQQSRFRVTDVKVITRWMTFSQPKFRLGDAKCTFCAIPSRHMPNTNILYEVDDELDPIAISNLKTIRHLFVGSELERVHAREPFCRKSQCVEPPSCIVPRITYAMGQLQISDLINISELKKNVMRSRMIDRGTNFREAPRANASHSLSHHYTVLGLDR